MQPQRRKGTKMNIPTWALRTAGPDDYAEVRQAHQRGTLSIMWPDRQALRGWAVLQGWPRPRFGIEKAILNKMLENEVNFQLAVRDSGIAMQFPRHDYAISPEKLQELDGLYDARSPEGRPTDWGWLVEELREIRRAVEAGVVVQVVDGPALHTWQDFYTWAHGRYHMLEDGYDHWIGDDAS
jgi:hypothetical protein